MQEKTRLLGLLILLIVAPGSLVAAGNPFAKLRENIQSEIKEKNIPSLAVAVIRDGKILWEEGFGWANRQQKIQATEHTMYSLASISKPITATGLMTLVQQQKIDLDHPVNQYLGEAKLRSPLGHADQATVRRIANHSSGLPLHYQFFYADTAHRAPPRDESIRRYGILVNLPGETYQYANFGYGILDHVIARVSGRSYASFMKEDIFLPLGMKHTSVGLEPSQASTAAVRYGVNQEPLANYHFDHPGASDVFSSAHDLIRFASLHLKKPLADQETPLSNMSIDAMQQATIETRPGVGYGVGWRITKSEFGFKTVTHTGGMPGVRTRLTLVPSKNIAVVALTNCQSDLPHRVVEQALAALLPEYARQLRHAEYNRATPPAPFPWAPTADWIGYWKGEVETVAGKQPIRLWIQPGGHVHVQLDHQFKHLLNHVRLNNGFLAGVFPGHLNTPDTNRRRHQLSLKIRLRGKQLNGALTALSLARSPQHPDVTLPRRSGYALSHWISLEKQSSLAGPRQLFDGKKLGQWEVIKKNDFEKHGKVTIKNGVLSLPSGQPATGIRWTGEFPRNHYEVSLQARRTKGNDFFCGITFPFNESYLSLIIGGWGGGVTGLSNIDNMAAVENETTGYVEVKDNHWYQVRLQVTPERIRAWVDGEEILDFMTRDHKFSIWWEQEPVRPFGIASWYTSTELRNIRIVPTP